ncbi:MAG: hypothetical protein ACK5TW_00285 [Cyanobacteriota bacterium]
MVGNVKNSRSKHQKAVQENPFMMMIYSTFNQGTLCANFAMMCGFGLSWEESIVKKAWGNYTGNNTSRQVKLVI